LNPPVGVFDGWYKDTYTYDPTANKVDLTCNFIIVGWVRKLTYYRDVLSQPIVRIRDSNTAGESIFSLHVVATGAVTKPDGTTMTPTTLEGTPFAIANGACFKFIGQYGVSCDVYYFGPAAQAFVGMWTHTYSGDIEDKQYILRIKTMGPCDTLMVPYPTGSRPAGLNVVQVAGGLRVNPASRTLAN